MLNVQEGTPDRGPPLVATTILLTVLCILSSITRLISKLAVKQKWWWDDLFAFISLLCMLVLFSFIFAWRKIGLGYHAEVIAAKDPLLLVTGARYLFISTLFFDGAVCFPKISALCFYGRVFQTRNRAFTFNLWAAGAVTSGWLISAWISTIFQCTPVAKAWNSTIPGHCINMYAWFLSTAILSCLIDVWILLLPVPMIWRLNMSLRRRIYLLCAFFITYSVFILSIGRLIVITQIIPTLANDLTWVLPLYIYWACFEGSISLICISAPNVIGLVKMLRNKQVGTGTNSTSGPSGPGTGFYSNETHSYAAQAKGVDRHGFQRLSKNRDTVPLDSESHSQLIAMGGRHDIALDRIQVQTDIHVSSGRCGPHELYSSTH